MHIQISWNWSIYLIGLWNINLIKTNLNMAIPNIL